MNVQKTTNTIDKVRELQRKLYLSATKSKKRKFHALYDKIYRMDILKQAWLNVKHNNGSAGIDDLTINEVERIGIDGILGDMSCKLKEGKYRPVAVKRVEIPKDNKGSMRPLGIPTVVDRIVQAAAKIVLEPIFEADFKESSYGFRPKKNAHNAIEAIRKACNNKGMWVLDADIKGYFNNINHDKLIKMIGMRINDRRILKLIQQWLKAGVLIDGEYLKTEIGSPQGGVISPLLANIYLHYLDVVWEKYYSKIGKLVKYADDFVIVCKNYKDVQHAQKAVEWVMNKLELTINKEKTKIVSLWEGKQGFDFLGYHHRMLRHTTREGREYYQLVQWISNKAKAKVQTKVKEFLARNTLYHSLEDAIEGLNRKIIGWRNYYGLSRWDKLNRLDRYIIMKLVMWFNQKRQERKRKDYYGLCSMFRKQGLVKLAI